MIGVIFSSLGNTNLDPPKLERHSSQGEFLFITMRSRSLVHIPFIGATILVGEGVLMVERTLLLGVVGGLLSELTQSGLGFALGSSMS